MGKPPHERFPAYIRDLWPWPGSRLSESNRRLRCTSVYRPFAGALTCADFLSVSRRWTTGTVYEQNPAGGTALATGQYGHYLHAAAQHTACHRGDADEPAGSARFHRHLQRDTFRGANLKSDRHREPRAGQHRPASRLPQHAHLHIIQLGRCPERDHHGGRLQHRLGHFHRQRDRVHPGDRHGDQDNQQRREWSRHRPTTPGIRPLPAAAALSR